MPKKRLLVRYAPRRGRGTSTTGGGARPTGGGLRRAGCGRRRGGSMRHRGVPASVRTKQVAQLNKIIKSAKSGKSCGSVVKKLKNWSSKAHKIAQKYGLYNKGLQAARLGYNAWQAKKGSTARIGYTPTQSIQYVDIKKNVTHNITTHYERG